MKLLVVLSAVLAATVARPGYLGAGIAGLLSNGIGAPAYTAPGSRAPGIIGGGRYLGVGAAVLGAGHAPVGGPANIVIGPDGVPADTPEVAAAKAGHAAAVAETHARDAAQAAADAAAGIYPGVGAGVGAGIGAGIGAGYGAAIGSAYGAGVGAGVGAPSAGLALYGPAHIVIGPNGVLQDTPDVASAKAAHADVVAQTQARDAAQAAADAASAAAGGAYAGIGYAGVGLGAVAAPSHGLARYGPANIQIGPGGVPLDTPEVAAGKVADAVSHLHAKSRVGHIGG